MEQSKLNKIKFLFISSSDLYGGASIAGYRIHKALLQQGYKSTMVVNKKISNDKTVLELNGFIKAFYKGCIFDKIKFPFSYRVGIIIRNIYNKFYLLLKSRGREIFFFPASRKIKKLIDYNPDIIHLHNIHGDYLNIKILNKWSKKSKIFITLHDLWLFTGHCGVPIDCDKFKFECGSCPDLKLPPMIIKDKTTENLNYKKKVINNIPINYIAPSKWVYKQINSKYLHHNSKIKIINNSLDINLYKTTNKQKYRLELGLPLNKLILLTCSMGFKNNPYKDLETVLNALEELNKNKISKNILLVVIGEEKYNYKNYFTKHIKFISKVTQDTLIRKYYSSSDIYIHSSHIETWGLAISEALSFGLPIISSNVGGIPEQVRGYKYHAKDTINKYNIDLANGILFPRGNISLLCKQIEFLYTNNSVAKKLGINAREYATNNLDINQSILRHLNFYSETINTQ